MDFLSFVEYYVACVLNEKLNPLKKKKKNCSLVSFKWDFHIDISNNTGNYHGTREFLSL